MGRGLSVAVVIAACAACAASRTSHGEAIAPVTALADRDGDGVPDVRDRCPDEPEDCDGFEDEDGCPDLDNDRDRILDTCDVCPNDPETYNGWGDRDGCPDSSADMHKYRSDPAFVYGHPIVEAYPARGEVEMPSKTLDAAIRTLASDGARVDAIACVAQASPAEKDPVALSAKRAQLACDAIVQRGVPRALIAGTFGVGMKPARSTDSPGNDPRIFILVTRAEGQAIWTWNGSWFEPPLERKEQPPQPKDPRCTETWAPPPPLPPPGGCRDPNPR
jgi:hypothetical protein